MCFSQGIWITKSRWFLSNVPMFLSAGEATPHEATQQPPATATRVAGSPTGERPGNRHCLIKAAGWVGKESFTPHLQFPQRVTQARILEDMKQKVWGGPKAPTASGLSLDNSGKTPLNQHLGKKNKRGKMGVSKLLKDREEENSFRKTRLPTRFKQNKIPARSSNQRKCDPNWHVEDNYWILCTLGFFFIFSFIMNT